MKARDREVNFELAATIISFIPEYIWENKTARFLDPSAQNGSFLHVIVQKLKQRGYSYQNIKGRVFGFFEDDYVKNFAINHYGLIGIFGKVDVLECKIDKTNKLIFNINNKKYIMNFDVICSNVPFGEQLESGKSNAGTTSRDSKRLGARIIEKVLPTLKPQGVMLMICPSGYYGSSSFLQKKLSKLNVLFINLSEYIKAYFNVGGTMVFSYFVLINEPKKDLPIVEFNNKIIKKLDILDWPISPIKSSNYEDWRILEKLLKQKDFITLNWKRRDRDNDNPSSFPYQVIMSGSSFNNYVTTENKAEGSPSYFCEFETLNEANYINNWLNHPIYRSLRWTIRSGPAIAGNIKYLPFPSINISVDEFEKRILE